MKYCSTSLNQGIPYLLTLSPLKLYYKVLCPYFQYFPIYLQEFERFQFVGIGISSSLYYLLTFFSSCTTQSTQSKKIVTKPSTIPLFLSTIITKRTSTNSYPDSFIGRNGWKIRENRLDTYLRIHKCTFHCFFCCLSKFCEMELTRLYRKALNSFLFLISSIIYLYYRKNCRVNLMNTGVTGWFWCLKSM